MDFWMVQVVFGWDFVQVHQVGAQWVEVHLAGMCLATDFWFGWLRSVIVYWIGSCWSYGTL